MSIPDFLKILRGRWITILLVALVTFLGSVAYTFTQTPMYQASTRLFVSNTNGDSAVDLYNGNRYSQDRVLSYTQLIMGETLAQRTIDRLGLGMSAAALKARVSAKSKPNTVLIDVSVLDTSPVRARNIANTLSDEFVSMAKELETPSNGAPPDARVVVEQRATVPSAPVVPKKKRNLALGALLGILRGVGLAVLRETLDNTVKTQTDVTEVAGVSVVGDIPFDKNIHENPAISFDTDNSGIAEAFRKLRTNLQFLEVDNPPRTLLITSTSPAEGKTTTAINIALALAEAEHSVALVDGDLRRPRIAKYLNLVNSVGVSSVLSGAAKLEDALQETRFPRLSILAAGPTPPNPSELLGTLAAEKMLAELRNSFDYVVIDSSPILAVTDGAILAAKADGALIVARARKTTREHLGNGTNILKDVGATLLGAVLTMAPVRRGGAYGYYYYGYGDDRPDSNSKSRRGN